MLVVYHYPKCSTCRKALAWLKARDVEYRAVDIVESPPSKATLKRAARLAEIPVKKLFNTSGQSYRSGGFKERLRELSDDDALAALAADGKLVKRPVLLGDDFACVGFDAERYERQLG